MANFLADTSLSFTSRYRIFALIRGSLCPHIYSLSFLALLLVCTISWQKYPKFQLLTRCYLCLLFGAMQVVIVNLIFFWQKTADSYAQKLSSVSGAG